jgi:hypothetical protein
MDSFWFKLRDKADLQILTKEVMCTSKIKGEGFNPDAMRCSVVRCLGIEIEALPPTDRFVDGVVEMIIDASSHYEKN